MDKKINKMSFTALLILLGCHFSASAQTLDSWRSANEQKIIQIEKVLKIKPSFEVPVTSQDRLRNIQNQIKKQLEQLPQRSQADGGVDSGGGSIVFLKDGRHQLLDFYVHRNEFETSRLDSLSPIKTQSTKSLSQWGIDRLDRNATVYHETIDKLILQFDKTSPFMATLVRNAIFNLPIYLVDYELGQKHQSFYLPKSEKNKEIKEVVTGALYFKNFGVFVSRKIFDQLNFEDQVGLLLHESLRHLQITHEYHFSDRDLQILTTAIVHGHSNKVNLDSSTFLKGKLREAYLLNLEAEVRKLMAEYACLEGARNHAEQCSEEQVENNVSVQVYKKESDLRVLKLTQFRYIDRIIADFQNSGWTKYKLEAELILEMLATNKIILRPGVAQ